MNFLLAHPLLLAAGDGPASKIGGELTTEIQVAFFVIVTGFAVLMLIKRSFSALIGFTIFVMFAAILVIAPKDIAESGVELFRWAFAGWLN